MNPDEIERMDRITATVCALLHGRTPQPIPLDGEPDDEVSQLSDYVNRLIAQWAGFSDDLTRITNGNITEALTSKLPVSGILASLQADLRHLTWQTRQIAKGDFTQRVDFLGDFSLAFNQMTHQLATYRQQIQQQAFDRGAGDMAASLIHHLGNLSNSLQTNVSDIERIFRAFPSAHVAKALEQYESHDTAEDRRNDLLRYLLAANQRSLESFAEIARACEAHAHVMNRLVEIITRFRETAKLTLHWEPCSLHEILDSVIATDGDLAGLSTTIRLDESIATLPHIQTDRLFLSQVLGQVLENAGAAINTGSERRGRILVRGHVDEEILVIEVQDNGIGIEPRDLLRVFAPDISRKSKTCGHSLGLHWCANVIRAMGGEIDALSDGVDKGTTIRIRLLINAPSK